MRCPTCETDNREGRRFCGKCGGPLPRPCSHCGFQNDPGDRFCGGCGSALEPSPAALPKEPPAESEAAPLARAPAASGSAAERTTSLGADAGPARRHLTVMFCDLVDSTALSERLDPEELSELLAAYQDACAAVINRFGGYIGRYVGDALLVYFGYPQAHEDDPQRAVRAGRGIVEAIEGLNARIAARGITLAVRIGINTGMVVAGDIGAGERREKMAIVGETPNVAARLQALAAPGAMVIGQRTRQLVEGLFLLEDLGAQSLKGVSVPVRAYRVVDETGAHNRFEAKEQRGLAPLVGREEEINILLRCWQRAKEGEAQTVLLSGEAGVGKSRLQRGFQDRIGGEPRNRVRYFGSPYHHDTPFFPVIEQLQRGLGFSKGDSPQTRLDKLELTLRDLDAPIAETAPLLASLLSLPTLGRYPALELSPEEQKKRTMAALVSLLGALASRDPVLMTVEDLHYVDASTMELLTFIIDGLAGSRLLLLMTFRPEFEPPWTRHPNVTRIQLQRLSRRESAALVNRVTGGKALPDAVFQQILAKTDGVPLFVEELTKTVLESGLLREAEDRYETSGPLPPLAIPASLHDSLMARLDRLAPVKEVAQLAAALGRSFSHELLAAVSRLADSTLEEALGRLIESELVYRRGLPPEVSYEFKHALVRDAAYSSLLRSKRRELHGEIARVLEEEFLETGAAKPELLAHHYREADMVERAIPFAIAAGNAARERYAASEARAHFQAALEMAKSLPPSAEARRTEAECILDLAQVARGRQQFEHDLHNLEHAQALAQQLDDAALLSRVVYWIGRTNYVLGQFEVAAGYAERALSLAESAGGDEESTARPINLLARIHCLLGEPAKASTYAARSVAQMHALGDPIEEAAVHGVLAFALALHGRFAEALEAAHGGVELAHATAHLPTVAACLMFRGVVQGWYGKLDAALADFEQALGIAEQAGDIFRMYLTYGWRGEAYLVADQIDAARDSLSQCLGLGERIGTGFHRAAFRALLAKACLEAGGTEAALAASAEALAGSEDSGQSWSHSIAFRVRAETLLRAQPPDLENAERHVRAALEIQERRECRTDLAWSRLVHAHVLLCKGDAAAAQQALAEAGELFATLGIARGLALARSAAAA